MLTIAIAILIYAIIGAGAGILGGLLGIGGGSITVPALLAVFTYFGMPETSLMHLAIGTSLAAMVVNTFAGMRAHAKRGAVKWDVVKKIIPAVVIGSIIGALVAHELSGSVLEILFGLFACAIGASFLRSAKIKPEEKTLPSFPIFTLIGTFIAGLSNILGVGGGIFMVPFLMFFNVGEKKSIGTSVAVSFLISVAGATAYLIFGMKDVQYSWSIGYIYLPAFAVISIVSYFSAPVGAYLAHLLPAPLLRKIFACAMIAIGLLMIFS